jgi:mRNA interferase RelE/StbE
LYRVELKPRARKFIEALAPKIQRPLIRRMEDLASSPRPPGSKLLQAEHKLYRVRAGDYRIVYQVQDRKKRVMVAAIGHRKDVYRVLGR